MKNVIGTLIITSAVNLPEEMQTNTAFYTIYTIYDVLVVLNLW
jgi:hypothetical protein